MRALPAGLLLLLLTRRLPRGSWRWRAPVVSLLTIGGLFVLVYVANQRLPSGVAAPLMATSAVITLVLARLLLDERASTRTWAGAITGIAGTVLLVGGAANGLDPLGVTASVAAASSASLGFVLAKRWIPPVSALTFTSWQLVFSGLALTLVALLVEGPPPEVDARTALALGWVSLVATALAYFVWHVGLARLPAGTVGVIGLLNPVSGAALGVLVAGETLTAAQLVGGVAILGGVAAGSIARATPAPVADTAANASCGPACAAARGHVPADIIPQDRREGRRSTRRGGAP